ncbi:hypothetical protein ACJW31_05G090600 [Castanea mollissima]
MVIRLGLLVAASIAAYAVKQLNIKSSRSLTLAVKPSENGKASFEHQFEGGDKEQDKYSNDRFKEKDLCSLVSLQRYTKALSTLQRASLVEKSRQKPQERMKVLCEALKCNNYDSEPFLRSCGISISTSFTQVDGRVLPAPRVVDAPEILTIIEKIPYLSEFLNSLYECQYKSFFVAFAGLTEQIKLDRYLHPHFRCYMREVRTVVYSQFLESYKSVAIEAMAKAFGVTVEFIDLELSRFIAAGKLHCKIDKVAGVLETNHPDAKNALYQATIKARRLPIKPDPEAISCD